ncbi:SCNM1 protein, partial [Glareola pratincola]|nr:SCNM1 protein [Glareola pratincola]
PTHTHTGGTNAHLAPGLSQKRRVADLLANYIPEDEALLLRSGRYACTVCAHRPVFDTLDVLTVHRAGKKHMSSNAGWYGHPFLTPPGPLARPPLSSVPSPQGSPAPLLARTRRIARSALLKAAPYSSCCRRTGSQAAPPQAAPPQRGPSTALTPPELSQKDGEAVDASPAALLPGHCGARPWSDTCSCGGESWPRWHGEPHNEPPLTPSVHLSIPSAGWIQDRSGKWVKDENAEFDSDEDEPPALLPA